MTEALGPEFEVVRGDHYFTLIRQANGLSVKPHSLEMDEEPAAVQ